MKRLLFYAKLLVPHVLFLGVYLVVFRNRHLFTDTPDEWTWAGYTFMTLLLLAMSLYLNRWHESKIKITDDSEMVEKLQLVLAKQGFKLKHCTSRKVLYNNPWIVSSFLTPGILIEANPDFITLQGPKVKVDDVVDWLEEQGYGDIQIQDKSFA